MHSISVRDLRTKAQKENRRLYPTERSRRVKKLLQRRPRYDSMPFGLRKSIAYIDSSRGNPL